MPSSKEFYIVNKHSLKVVECQDGGQHNGTRLQLYELNHSPAQRWCWKDGMLINTGADRALDLNCNRTENGEFVQIWDQTWGPAQKWRLEFDQIVHAEGGEFCLDVQGMSNQNGTPVHLWQRNGSGAQQFYLMECPEP